MPNALEYTGNTECKMNESVILGIPPLLKTEGLIDTEDEAFRICTTQLRNIYKCCTWYCRTSCFRTLAKLDPGVSRILLSGEYCGKTFQKINKQKTKELLFTCSIFPKSAQFLNKKSLRPFLELGLAVSVFDSMASHRFSCFNVRKKNQAVALFCKRGTLPWQKYPEKKSVSPSKHIELLPVYQSQ